MINIADDIKRHLSDPSLPISADWAKAALDRYPYCVLPALLYLKQNGIDGNDELLARVAIATPDRKALAMLLGTDAKRFAAFYPDEPLPETPDTDTTIDRFLNSYGNSSPKEIEAISNAIFNPTPDYADVLLAKEKEEGHTKPAALTKEDELINSFIAQTREREKQVPQQMPQTEINATEKAEIANDPVERPSQTNDSMLSESLAKMYISQHKYSKALQIIQNISLTFPEKSIYFADQIRFLKKLILNEKYLNKT